jgi:hypothetical protein
MFLKWQTKSVIFEVPMFLQLDIFNIMYNLVIIADNSYIRYEIMFLSQLVSSVQGSYYKISCDPNM